MGTGCVWSTIAGQQARLAVAAPRALAATAINRGFLTVLFAVLAGSIVAEFVEADAAAAIRGDQTGLAVAAPRALIGAATINSGFIAVLFEVRAGRGVTFAVYTIAETAVTINCACFPFGARTAAAAAIDVCFVVVHFPVGTGLRLVCIVIGS